MKEITPEIGTHLGIPERVYRAAEGENVSALLALAKSPKKYQHALTHPMEATSAMEFGTALHALTLEPHREPDDVCVVSPYPDFRTKEAKEWRDTQTLPVFKSEAIERLRECRKAILTHPRAGWIMQQSETGTREVSVWKHHGRTGLLLKGRLDIIFQGEDNRIAIADLKKCQNSSRDGFTKSLAERMYNVQAAFYCDIIGASDFYFIAIEEDAPFEVAVHKLSDEDLDLGRQVYERLLDKLVECRAKNRWPGASDYEKEISVVSLPMWARKLQEAI